MLTADAACRRTGLRVQLCSVHHCSADARRKRYAAVDLHCVNALRRMDAMTELAVRHAVHEHLREESVV